MSKIGRDMDLLKFDFQFCGDLVLGILLSSADDLFDGGKIKPLKLLQKSEIMTVAFTTGGLDQSSSDQRRDIAVDSFMSPHCSGGSGTVSHSPIRIGAKASLRKSSSVFRKWNLKDFLLFNKYPWKKLETMGKEQDDRKSTSFRSADGSFDSEVRMRKKSQMSAHEVFYTKNKAKSESLKKRTYK